MVISGSYRTMPGIGTCATPDDAACYCAFPSRFREGFAIAIHLFIVFVFGVIRRCILRGRIGPQVWRRCSSNALVRLWAVRAGDDRHGRCAFPAVPIYAEGIRGRWRAEGRSGGIRPTARLCFPECRNGYPLRTIGRDAVASRAGAGRREE
jgi:hypothetical protein